MFDQGIPYFASNVEDTVVLSALLRIRFEVEIYIRRINADRAVRIRFRLYLLREWDVVVRLVLHRCR